MVDELETKIKQAEYVRECHTLLDTTTTVQLSRWKMNLLIIA